MIVAIHQPEAFPWLGFFHKMHLADVFVLLDTVQFEKNNVQNRNKILVNGKSTWLTIPVVDTGLGTKIKDVKIHWDDGVVFKKHLATLRHAYGKHPHFNDVNTAIEEVYSKRHDNLADFNSEVILYLKEKLGITTKIMRASELPLSGTAQGGTEVTLEICKLLGAKTYLSGSGAKAYLDVSQYKKEGIAVVFQDFAHPSYPQKNTDKFVSHLSIIDLYSNHGPESLDHILRDNPRSL